MARTSDDFKLYSSSLSPHFKTSHSFSFSHPVDSPSHNNFSKWLVLVVPLALLLPGAPQLLSKPVQHRLPRFLQESLNPNHRPRLLRHKHLQLRAQVSSVRWLPPLPVSLSEVPLDTCSVLVLVECSVDHRAPKLLRRQPNLSKPSLRRTLRGALPRAKPMRRALQSALTITRETCRSAVGIWINW